MPRPNYRIPSFCVVCTSQIPDERVKKSSVTCKRECADARRRAQRTLQDDRKCRYCSRPSSPEERAAFNRFRKLEAARPDLLYPQAFKEFQVESEAEGTDATPEAFAKVYAKVKDEFDE